MCLIVIQQIVIQQNNSNSTKHSPCPDRAYILWEN